MLSGKLQQPTLVVRKLIVVPIVVYGSAAFTKARSPLIHEIAPMNASAPHSVATDVLSPSGSPSRWGKALFVVIRHGWCTVASPALVVVLAEGLTLSPAGAEQLFPHGH